jgi:hypothetical protein
MHKGTECVPLCIRFLTTARVRAIVPLRPDLPTRRAPRDERWNVLVNENVDVEP